MRIKFVSMIRIGALLGLACSVFAGSRSLVLQSSGTFATGKVHATIPNAAPYNSSGTERVEFRLHNWTPPTPSSPGLEIARFHGCITIRFLPFEPNTLEASAACDGSQSNSVRIDTTGRNDIVVRVQRDLGSRSILMELWNGDRSNYVQRSASVGAGPLVNNRGGNIEVSLEYSSGNLAWLRWYSTLTELGAAPPGEGAGGDLADWEFEGNLTDSSGRGRNLSGSTMTYTNTALYPPHCDAGPTQTARTGYPITLDGSRSYVIDDGSITYSWVQVAGPNTSAISDATDPKPTLQNLQSTIGGGLSYQYQLTVSSGSAGSTSCTTKVGVVTTDSNDVITDVTSYSSALGPLTRWGTGPWPWYEISQKAVGDILSPSARSLPSSLNTPFEGTLTVSEDHPPKVVGTGTLFLTRLGSPVCTGTGNTSAQSCTISAYTLASGTQIAFKPSQDITAPFTLSINGSAPIPVPSGAFKAASYYPLSYNGTNLTAGWFGLMHLWWNAEGYPAGAGRSAQSIATIEDETHLTLGYFGLPFPVSQAQNIRYGRMDISAENYSVWGFGGLGGSNNWNYYDAVLGLYRLWMRTGIDDYLVNARRLADDWWVIGIDHGADPLAPRLTGLHGMLVRALDGRPEMWNGIHAAATILNGRFNDPTTDTRETAYDLRYKALVARYSPDAAIRTQYCGYLATNIVSQWASKQTPEGYWPQDIYGQNHDYPFRGSGTLPYMLGLALHGLRYTHESMVTSCDNPAIADLTLQVLAKGASYLKNYSQGSSRGLFFAVGYGSWPPNPPQIGPGLINGSANSTHLAVSAAVTPLFACNGTDYIGVDTLSKVFRVESCPSAAEIVIDVPLPQAVSNSTYHRALRMATQCAPSLSATCADTVTGLPPNPSVGDRNLIGDVKASFGYLFTVTGDTKYISWGDDFMGADYGGPANGPGFPSTPCPGAGCAGPGADGNVGAYISALPPCNISAPPCGGFGVESGLGKYFGMGDGAGDTPNYLAFRTGSLRARQVQVDVPFQRIPNATHARLLVNQPSGPVVQVCTVTPCAVAVDAGLVQPLITVEYLDAGDRVLSSSIPPLRLK